MLKTARLYQNLLLLLFGLGVCSEAIRPVTVKDESVKSQYCQALKTIGKLGKLNPHLRHKVLALKKSFDLIYQNDKKLFALPWVTKNLILAKKCDHESIENLKNFCELLCKYLGTSQVKKHPIKEHLETFTCDLAELIDHEEFLFYRGGSWCWWAKKNALKITSSAVCALSIIMVIIFRKEIVDQIIPPRSDDDPADHRENWAFVSSIRRLASFVGLEPSSYVAEEKLSPAQETALRAYATTEFKMSELAKPVTTTTRYLSCDAQHKNRCHLHAQANAWALNQLSTAEIEADAPKITATLGQVEGQVNEFVTAVKRQRDTLLTRYPKLTDAINRICGEEFAEFDSSMAVSQAMLAETFITEIPAWLRYNENTFFRLYGGGISTVAYHAAIDGAHLRHPEAGLLLDVSPGSASTDPLRLAKRTPNEEALYKALVRLDAVTQTITNRKLEAFRQGLEHITIALKLDGEHFTCARFDFKPATNQLIISYVNSSFPNPEIRATIDSDVQLRALGKHFLTCKPTIPTSMASRLPELIDDAYVRTDLSGFPTDDDAFLQLFLESGQPVSKGQFDLIIAIINDAASTTDVNLFINRLETLKSRPPLDAFTAEITALRRPRIATGSGGSAAGSPASPSI